tara:strand:- start:165 stop:638 length:474 start_codon:yes stop_codon:yes gene_type:complete
MGTNLFLNIDVRANFNSLKNEYQVIHVETSSDSIYVIGACFATNGEIEMEQGRKFFDEISISKLTLRNIKGLNKKIVSAEIKALNNEYVYELFIHLENDPDNILESIYIPPSQNLIIFKRCHTDNRIDVTIKDVDYISIRNEMKRDVGPKICQFRIT